RHRRLHDRPRRARDRRARAPRASAPRRGRPRRRPPLGVHADAAQRRARPRAHDGDGALRAAAVSAASAATAPERSAEPNITPLIDVMLVLLIISMLMAVPSRGLDVALPRPAAPGRTPPTAPPPALVLAVHADDVALAG